jgi:hypothetical protein
VFRCRNSLARWMPPSSRPSACRSRAAALCVDDYVRGDYEAALQQPLKPGFDVGFWGAMLRAAVLGQLGRGTDARVATSELVAHVPDFERRGAELVHRPILSDAIVESLLEGLGKAGLYTRDA